MVTLIELQDRLDAVIIDVEVYDLASHETVVMNKLKEELDLIITGSTEEQLEKISKFKLIYHDFITYINDKYKAQVGSIDGRALRPYLKEVLKIKREALQLLIEPEE